MSDSHELPGHCDVEEPGFRVDRRCDGVAVVVLDRPGCLNALTPALMLALRAELEQLAEDPEVRAIVVSGANGAFSAGAELSLIESLAALAVDQLVDLLAEAMRMTVALWAMPQPTIAAIEGPAAGGGLALALACDLRVASPDAVLVSPFIHMGMAPDCGVSWMLPRLVGEGRALEMMLTGHRLDAGRGEQLGLFTKVCAEPLAAALELAAILARRPAAAVRATKQLVRTVAEGSLAAAIDQEAQVQAAAMHGPEFARMIGPWKASRRAD